MNNELHKKEKLKGNFTGRYDNRHITPLAMGGEDDVENLSCTCYPCNLFKGNILPSDFMERITDIFLYQMEKQHKGIRWKIVHKMLNKMI